MSEPWSCSSGTAHAVTTWRERGFEHVTIDIRTV
jgi:hypothetical protein